MDILDLLRSALEYNPLRDELPVVAWFMFLSIIWLATLAIRKLLEGMFYWTRWWQFRLGDPLGVAPFAGFAAAALQGYQRQGRWYESWWFALIVCVAVALFVVHMEREAVQKNWRPAKNAWVWSQAYHSLMFVVIATWIITASIPLLTSTWSIYTVLSILALGFYGWTVYLDRAAWNLGPETTPRWANPIDRYWKFWNYIPIQ